MNPWWGKAALLAAIVLEVVIRAPHANRSSQSRVVDNRKGGLEVALLILMAMGYLLLPLAFIATPILSFADYPLHPAALGAGLACLLAGLWLFHRSHADLGRNWSVTLEIREGHALVTSGVYSRIRHPMYTAIYLHAVAQALLLANWVAGPACLVTFTVMFALRVGAEERMMLDRFGEDYVAYRQRTKRLVPGVW